MWYVIFKIMGTLTIDKADLTVGDVTEFFEYTKTGAQTINIASLVPGARRKKQ